MYRFQRKNDSIWLLGKNEEIEFKPTKVVCVGLNYKAHAKELNMDIPKEPLLFLKPTSSIILDQEDIIYPKASTRVDYEGELAIVISKTSKKLSYKDAKDVILGFCIANDVTARDLQKKDIQFTRAKSFDTFCPVGPAVVKM
jgi:2-keto-4-pentenoate hydratase/2-oxohepta-3-ene-1,7-dioic acid hydratase (catechol pathway)